MKHTYFTTGGAFAMAGLMAACAARQVPGVQSQLAPVRHPIVTQHEAG